MDLKQLEQKIDKLEKRLANLELSNVEHEEINERVPFEVEVPDDIEMYFTTDAKGELKGLRYYTNFMQEQLYKRGEAFEYREDAFAHDKEKVLLKKLEDWADWRNGDWYPDWESDDDKFSIYYYHSSESFSICSDWNCNSFSKLPHFKSEELAREFIEEFGDEIKEVLL